MAANNHMHGKAAPFDDSVRLALIEALWEMRDDKGLRDFGSAFWWIRRRLVSGSGSYDEELNSAFYAATEALLQRQQQALEPRTGSGNERDQ